MATLRVDIQQVSDEIAAKQSELRERIEQLLECLDEQARPEALSSLVKRAAAASGDTSSPSLNLCGLNSFDPNNKIGADGVGLPQYIKGGLPTSYLIQFENLSTATAPASEITVTDTLDSSLNLSELSINNIQLGSNSIDIPAGSPNFQTIVDFRPAKNLLVSVETKLTGSVLSLHLQTLDPATGKASTDPLMGVLPPNMNPPEGEGSISYTISPKSTVVSGTKVLNHAAITFDNNVSIQTPEWMNTIDADRPTSDVLALSSTQTSTAFPVYWAGSDIGSGLDSFDIWVSDNGGPFTLWQSRTTSNQAVFNGVTGHAYGFYSIASDLVGYTESAKTKAEAATVVLGGLPGDVNDDGKVDCDDVAIVKAAFGKKAGTPGFDARADVNNDGVVDIRDLAFVSQHLSTGTQCQ